MVSIEALEKELAQYLLETYGVQHSQWVAIDDQSILASARRVFDARIAAQLPL